MSRFQLMLYNYTFSRMSRFQPDLMKAWQRLVKGFLPKEQSLQSFAAACFHTKIMATSNSERKSFAVDLKKYADKKGEFVRTPSSFRDFIAADGGELNAERNRYHLYVSLACPWAHRTIILRKLKGLESIISLDVVDWYLGKEGWRFNPDVNGSTSDTVNGFGFVKEVYFQSDSDYNGRVTVPILYDKKFKKIINNESSEIIRMLNAEFNEFCATPEQKGIDLYPKELHKTIDDLNEWIYKGINNGVYRAGFAQTQEAYDGAVKEIFTSLDRVEDILSKQRYLAGSVLTEADVRLYTTLVRFDPVYVGHFKCNKKRIVDYPNIWGYLRDLYNTTGFGDTTNRYHIEHHYMGSHEQINPNRIIPIGPDIDYSLPHDRDTRFQ